MPRMGFPRDGAIGFALAAVFAFAQEWSLPEFCWSTWVAGLVYAWALLGDAYPSLTILLLMGLFYLLPKKKRNCEAEICDQPANR